MISFIDWEQEALCYLSKQEVVDLDWIREQVIKLDKVDPNQWKNSGIQIGSTINYLRGFLMDKDPIDAKIISGFLNYLSDHVNKKETTTITPIVRKKLQVGTSEYEILEPLIMNAIIASTGYDSQFTFPIQELCNMCEIFDNSEVVSELRNMLTINGWKPSGFQSVPNKKFICEYLQSII